MQLSSEMNQMTKNNIKSIFTDSFPFIKSDKELQALIKKYPKYDNYYIASGSIKARRNKFNALYQKMSIGIWIVLLIKGIKFITSGFN